MKRIRYNKIKFFGLEDVASERIAIVHPLRADVLHHKGLDIHLDPGIVL
ncbi:hypothetical protein PA08_1530 [Cutibacterium modestum P08]|nr:hypothetical protein PA08_1530 [Cutibacterium modestum P08]